MSKKKKPIFIDPILNITYELDSNEECLIYEWCIELLDNGFIETWTIENPIYQPQSFQLSNSVKISDYSTKKEKVVLRPHVYTPDFKLCITKAFKEKIIANASKFLRISNENEIYFDVKGSFNNFSGDRVFSINQKWMYQVHKIFINKIIPDELFSLTFVPKNCLYTSKTHKFREKYKNCLTIDSYIDKV